jgi:hypothetical protein
VPDQQRLISRGFQGRRIEPENRERVPPGQWEVDDKGRFCSFWPPSYRACYDVRWIVEGGSIVGLSFIELQAGTRLDGRYR